ncbi:helix-turn-helix transcriptional regulator [Brucella sp. H1_1004]|uniref:XRE family transcriptional regulator n=1 Tax=Brucella sp. H1_1004 TaxID=3110109 RepID=UPI0039B49389
MRDMSRNELAIKVGTAIRVARKQRGMVMRQIAEHLNTKTAAVGNWEIGKNLPSTENLIKVANLLRVDAAALGQGNVIYLGDEPVNDAEVISDLHELVKGPLDVEIRGVAVGGDDGDFSLNGEIAGYVRRPPGISGIRKVFALHVLSDSMWPRYEQGELVYCGGRDAIPGDDVVIEMFPKQEGDLGHAYIKRLVKRSKTEIVCLQFNPQKEISFDPYEIKNMWRVIPLRELLGY